VNGGAFERISPFTRDAIATVPSGDAADAEALAEAAWAAR